MKYINKFANLAIYPSKGWKIISQQTSKIKKAEAHIYQTKDDELPIYDGQLKRLFLLQLSQKQNKKIIDCELELGILKDEKHGLTTDHELIGTGKTFSGEKIVDAENGSEWLFLAAPFQKGYWFYLKIVVYRAVMRETALAAFRSIIFDISKPALFLGESFENAMAAAYGYPLYLALPEQSRILIHFNCSGSFMWNEAGEKIYFTFWKRTDSGILNTYLACFEIKNKQSIVFEKPYSALKLEKLENDILFATESPIYQPKQLLIDVNNL
jgi:hypothetical protein